MGNYCCEEPTNLGQLSYDPSLYTKFEATATPIITNKLVEERLLQLEDDKLEIDEGKYEGVKLRGPQKQVTKDYVYEGTWRDNVPEGRGSIVFKNNEFFQGEFTDGKANGKGRFIRANGDYYEGNIIDNNANGRGRYVGAQYDFEGEWNDSKPTFGQYTMKATGTVIQILKQNYGNITWTNGDYYQGAIKEQNPDGKGKIWFKNKNSYEGSWKNGTFYGYGEYIFANGQKYSGDYENGIKHGQGTYEYSNGRKYVGEWKNGKQDGYGKLFIYDKIAFEGNFQDGEIVEEKLDQSLDPRGKQISYSNNSFLNRDTM